jgi:hypothetical protein
MANHGYYRIITILLILVLIINNSIILKSEDISETILFDIQKYRSVEEGTIYGEVLSYSEKTPFGDAHGRPTNVHETSHEIASELTNKYRKISKNNTLRGFYYGDGKGIILQSPNITISEVSQYIPEKFRGYRFQLYFVDQLPYWNDTPLYILDEWTAYIWGARCSVEDYNTKNIETKSDSVSGSLEFSLYTLALCLTIIEKDNHYWQNHTQFKTMVKEHLQRAEKVFFEGKDIFKSTKQQILLDSLKNTNDSEPIKKLLIEEFDNIFLRKLTF